MQIFLFVLCSYIYRKSVTRFYLCQQNIKNKKISFLGVVFSQLSFAVTQENQKKCLDLSTDQDLVLKNMDVFDLM